MDSKNIIEELKQNAEQNNVQQNEAEIFSFLNHNNVNNSQNMSSSDKKAEIKANINDLLKEIFWTEKELIEDKCYKSIHILGKKFLLRDRKEEKINEKLEIKKLKNDLLNIQRQNYELRDNLQQIAAKADLYYTLINLPKINKEKIYSEMQNRDDYSGITDVKRDTKIIISVTSYPDRMYDIHYCLYSLLNQSIKPDEIILWLGEEQFFEKEGAIPHEILKLKNNGLTIRFTKDIKSYTKLIPALNEYPNDIIVTADDDIYYPKDWLEKLYDEYQKDSNNIICHRAHKVRFDENNKILPYLYWQHCIDDYTDSFSNFITGVGGVLYPPNSLYKDVCNEKLFMKLCPQADDVWFWAMTILNNKKIKVVENPINRITYINPERELGYLHEKTLYQINKMNNDIQINNIISNYPCIVEYLSAFSSSDYWEQRYKKNGNSGAGSYNNLAEFKAKIINSFIQENDITSVIEFGCGDGNQLSLFNIQEYVGYDVSPTVLMKIREKFADYNNYHFDIMKNYANQKADLTMSLDVIYHLVEDDVYVTYMDNLFNASNKYVIIYSSNEDKPWYKHVKHRKFTSYVELKYPQWKCIKKINNIYPYNASDPEHTSFSDFYIFKRNI